MQKIYKSYGKNQKLNDFNFETMYSNRSDLFAKEFKENNSFWEGKLQSVITPPSMVPTQNLGKLNKDDLILNNHVRKKLKVIQRKHNVSLFSILISVYVLMLHKMHNFKNNIVFNEPETTRNNLKTMILGVYVNIIPLVIRRSWLDKDMSFIEFVKKVEEYRSTEKPYISMNNQDLLIQGETIFGVNHIPLFGKSFFSTGSVGKNEVQFTVYSSKTPFVRFSYHYGFFGDGKPTNNYELILDAILDDDTKKLKNINIVSEKEKHWLLDECNNTKKDYPREKTIHRVFEEKVKNTPNAIAVVYKDKEIAYKELNEEANKLANYLIQQGVEVEDLIGICVDRSIEMVVGLLAVLKAGAAYVPIDPTYPKDRINYMIKDSKASFILTQMHLKEFLVNVKSAIIFLDRINLKDFSIKNPKVNMSSRNLAYVIFTSGSTGKPKGVMVEHNGLVNLYDWYRKKSCFNRQTSVLIISSLSFDLTQKNIFSILHSGGSLIFPSYGVFSPSIIVQLIDKHKVTLLNCTPSAYYAILEAKNNTNSLHSLKTVYLGGEPINFKKVIAPELKLKIINSYGPTECSDVVTSYLIDKQDTPKNIPIGKPINNTQIYLLDDNLNLVPRSVVGELCISGDGLARGYLNSSKLTSQKFVDNPYLEGERLYKTGDLAKYLEDGNIEYVGRVDEQVKIRGFRIELGEIEQKLLSISNFKEGCVIVKNDEVLGKMLVAYVTVINNQDIDSKEVIFHLERILPRHMIPSVVIKLKEMPLTLNGKIDKKYLSELDVTFISSEEYIEPQTNTQERLVKLFQEILDVDRVGIKDNFFDLGGHSLLATQLISKINREFNVQFQLKLLFELGNIKELSGVLDVIKNDDSTQIEDKDNLREEFIC